MPSQAPASTTLIARKRGHREREHFAGVDQAGLDHIAGAHEE